MKRFVLLWALSFGMLPFAYSQVSGVTAEMSLAETELLPDQDMELRVRIENYSGQDLVLGKSDHWISFSITDEHNVLVRQLADTSVAHEFSVSSAQAGICKFNLTPFFDFRAPGRYSVVATIQLPQWSQQFTCKPVSFSVVEGIRLTKIPDIQFGVPLPPGVKNAAPETRKYVLKKVNFASGMKLFCQLTDGSGAKTLKVLPIGPMLAVSDPAARIDKFSNLHVLNQTGARAFSYYVIDPNGELLFRQTYEYSTTRPELAIGDWGEVAVKGGVRKKSDTDFPPPEDPATVSVKP